MHAQSPAHTIVPLLRPCTLRCGAVLVVEMPTPERSFLEDKQKGKPLVDVLYKVGAADGFVGATAAQLAKGINLEDALPLSCALSSMSLLARASAEDVSSEYGMAAEPNPVSSAQPSVVLSPTQCVVMSMLQPVHLQATGAVSSYVSGVVFDGQEETGKAEVERSSRLQDDEVSTMEQAFSVIGQGNKNQRERGERVGSAALVKRAMRLASSLG